MLLLTRVLVVATTLAGASISLAGICVGQFNGEANGEAGNVLKPALIADASLTRPSDRLVDRLSALRKPAGELTLSLKTVGDNDAEGAAIEPVNLAAVVMSDQPVTHIVASFYSIPQPVRYHIAFQHRPTFFQELNLERCGRLDCECCGCLQNAYSSLWFLTNAALLPYRIGSQSPHQCVPSYGDCLACHDYGQSIEPLGLTDPQRDRCRGVLLQAASMAGFAFLIW